MAEQQRDQPTDNNGSSSGGLGGKIAGAAKGLLQKVLKSLKTFGILGTIFVGIIIAIVVVLIIIGIVGFFLEMPSLMSDKINELKDGILQGFQSFFSGNVAYITEDDQLELAQYLENMGYPPYEFGFGKYEETEEENEETGETEQVLSIDSKYLTAYLLADYNTYEPYDSFKADISGVLNFFFGNPISYSPEDVGTDQTQFGMLHFDESLYEGGSLADFLIDNVIVNMQDKTLTLRAWSPDGLLAFRTSDYIYDMEGWSARYGKPLTLSLTLHLATMAPDLAYKLIMDEEENTAINIGRIDYSVGIKMEYRLKTTEDGSKIQTNFGDLDESLADLDGKTEFTTEDLKKMKSYIESHKQTGIVENMQLAEQNLQAFLNSSFDDTMSEVRKWDTDGARYLFANLTDETLMSGYNGSPSYENAIVFIGSIMNGAMEDARDKASSYDKELDFSEDDYEEVFGTAVGVYWDEDGKATYENPYAEEGESGKGILGEYSKKLAELCNENDIKGPEDLVNNDEVKEEAYNFMKEQLTELYNTKLQYDMDIVYEVSGKEEANELQTELEKIGLSLDAINRALYYNDSLNSDSQTGEKITKVVPYIESVTKHWYRNVYFTISSAEDAGEGDYISENYPDWTGAYTKKDVSTPSEHEFHPAEGGEDSVLESNESGSWYVIETNLDGEAYTQVADAVRGEVNEHTKELFVGTEDRPAKYFVYDGSTEAADKIEELREIYNSTYLNALYNNYLDEEEALKEAEEAVEAQEEKEGTNYFKEVDVRSNALAAFSILENDDSEDAEYILRDLKNLFVDLGYFTKEELRTKDTHVFQWPLSGYFNPYWPQKRFEKQQRDYGTIIRSKVSTDNIRNGNNADGSVRTDEQTQSSIYGPNLNPDATVTVTDTSVPDLDDDDENADDEEQNEITNPTDTLVDGFEAGLNVLSPVTGEIIEEGSDYLKIKVMDNTAIPEYEPFYNKYEDVCTGYILYIKGFKKGDINSNSASEYKKVTHTDAYFTQYGYDPAGMEEWREDEDKRVEAPVYIERDGKKYIKEGTVIGTTTNSDIVIYLINRENSIVEDVESYIRLAKKGIDTDFPEEFIFWLGVLLEGGCEGQYDLGSNYGVEVLADGAGNTTAFGLTKAIAGVGDVPEMYPNFAEHLASGQVPKEEAQGVFLLVLEAGRESVLEQIENDDALSESELDALVDLNHASPSECSQVCDIFNEKGALTLQDFEDHWGTNTNYEETLKRRGHVRGMLATAEEYRYPYSASTPKYTFLSETPWSDFVGGTPSADLYTLEGS